MSLSKTKIKNNYTNRLLVALTDVDELGHTIDKTKRLVCIAKTDNLVMACYIREGKRNNFFKRFSFYLKENEVIFLSKTLDDLK